MLYGIFGFFRLGEILLQSGCTYDSNIHLSVGDVAVDNVEDLKMVQISLKHFKTDQFGQGSKIYVGRTKMIYAQWLQSWLI